MCVKICLRHILKLVVVKLCSRSDIVQVQEWNYRKKKKTKIF